MSGATPLGDDLQINAYAGTGTVSGPPDADWTRWGIRRQLTAPERFLAPPPDAAQHHWQDPRVGWGLLLPENEAISEGARAAAEDAPEPIRRLLDARPGSPVFRYRADTWGSSYLRRYFADRAAHDTRITGGATGTKPGHMPRYLLIVGSPEQVPWEVQFRLNVSVCVGRLDLPPEGLGNYVDALIARWPESLGRSEAPVVWAVDHGHDDITWLMRRVIAEKVGEQFTADDQIGERARLLMGDQATVANLTDALAAVPPRLVITASHGMTGPLDDPVAMARDLGMLVDQNRQLLHPGPLLERWQPDGAIWYAHACCSAGSDRLTRFKGLVDAESQVGRTLEAVAALGAHTAPFPTALLGAKRPLGAFVGHVEPTFNWTLRDPRNKQVLTSALVRALYNRLFATPPEPIGLALERSYDLVGELFTEWASAVEQVNAGESSARAAATLSQLTALDRQSMVVLGDPTVALPPLPPG